MPSIALGQKLMIHSRRDAGGGWIWTASARQGYGQVWTSAADGPRRLLQAHRASYELARGPIPDGLDLDHLCRERLYINPDHLEPVSRRTNILRGTAPAAVNARKERCAAGHAYTPCPWPSARGRRRCCPCKHSPHDVRSSASDAATTA